MDALGRIRKPQPKMKLAMVAILLAVLFCITWKSFANSNLSPEGGISSEKISETPIDAPILRVDTGVHSAAIRRIAVAETRNLVVTTSDDKTGRVWALNSGKLLSVLRPPIGPNDLGRLYGAAIHPSRPVVALGGISASEQPKLYLFDVVTGRLVQSIDAGGGEIKRLAWSRDGSVLLAGFAKWNGVRAFDEQGRQIYEQATPGSVYGLAAANDDRVAATDFTGKLHVLRAAGGKVERLSTLPVRDRNPVSVAFDPSGTNLVVGYRYYDTPAEVIESASGRVLRRLNPAGALEGDFGAVAWSPDGGTIFVAGTASRSGYRYPIWRFSADTGKSKDVVNVAGNSILDMVPLKDGRVVYGSFEASWGVLGRQVELRVEGGTSDLRGASNLQISADARRIAWAYSFGADKAHFDLGRRILQRSVPTGLRGAQLDRAGWNKRLQAGYEAQGEAKKRYTAIVNGVTIKFDDVELASCGTYLRTSSDAILGSTKALYRYDENGRARWRLSLESEVTAVVASENDSLLVLALADGIIQWRRADNGTLLLSFFPARDGRWIIWSPEGYFDASPGAERMVNWVVNRGANEAADAYPLARFRDQYRRPDIIDRVLEKLDTRIAIESAQPSHRASLMQPEAPRPVRPQEVSAIPNAPSPNTAAQTPPRKPDARQSAEVPLPTSPVAPAGPSPQLAPRPKLAIASVAAGPSPKQFPPLLTALGPRSIAAENEVVNLPFAVRSAHESVDHWLEVRIGGRPVLADQIKMPARLDGKAGGSVWIGVAPGQSVVHLIVGSAVGYSEPLIFEISAPESRKPKPSTASSPPVGAIPTPEKLTEGGCPTDSPTKRGEASLTRKNQANLYIVAVGVSKYQQADYELDFPAKDAKDFVSILHKQSGRQYGEVTSHVLTNAQATRRAVLNCLHWLSTTVGSDDVAMLFLAGHGINEDSGQYYFLPHDAVVEQIDRTGVAETELRNALKEIRGRTIFFVDTCFAGNAVGDPRLGRRALSRLADDLASAENGVIVFAGSSGRQESQESKDWGNGAFTKSLVEGLRGAADYNKVGHVTFKALDFFVSDAVSKLTKGAQTPVTITPIGIPDFVLATTRL